MRAKPTKVVLSKSESDKVTELVQDARINGWQMDMGTGKEVERAAKNEAASEKVLRSLLLKYKRRVKSLEQQREEHLERS